MRKPREIEKWIKNQEWYDMFVANLDNDQKMSGEYSEVEIDDFLNGKKYARTIEVAFMWEDTPEGLSFWKAVNYEFTKWFYEEEED